MTRVWEEKASCSVRRLIACRILIGPFLQKSPINSGSFAESDLRVKAFYPVGLRRFIGCCMLIGPFLQKSPVIGGSFVESVLRLKASYGSPPPCTSLTPLYNVMPRMYTIITYNCQKIRTHILAQIKSITYSHRHTPLH